jgi:hypothetical protein
MKEFHERIRYNKGMGHENRQVCFMGSSFAMYASVIGVAMVGFLATLWIGASRENREGNPEYDRASLPNWIRLSVIYVIATAVFFGLMIWIMRR